MKAVFVEFTSGERTLTVVVALTSAASVLSIVFLLIKVGVAALRPLAQGLRGRMDSQEVLFFQSQVGIYVACLLLANLLSGISGLIGFSWAGLNGITAGQACTVQGILIQIGDFAGAYFTAYTAIHTFQTLVMHKRYPTWVTIVAVLFGWGSAIALGTALITLAIPKHGPFFNGVGLWCAISSGYTVAQFVVYYLPIIVSAFVTALLYALIYLCLRGTLIIGDGIKLNLSPENVRNWAGRLNGREEYRHFLGSIVRSLLWYPFTFISLFLPITIAGLLRISGMVNSNALLGFAGICASLVGMANVLILYNTLRILRPAINAQNESKGSESFFTPEERKLSPTEAPKHMIFGVSSSPLASTSPRTVMHGRAFPPPVSRVGSPLSSSGSSTLVGLGLPSTQKARRPPTPRRSIDQEQQAEHAPTPQMMQTWLRHQRSSSSVDSTSALLHASSSIPGNPGHSRSHSLAPSQLHSHSRSTSISASENIHALVGGPIVPHTELNMQYDAGLRSAPTRNQTDSSKPVITISRPVTPDTASVGLPPAPRPQRESQVSRASRVNVGSNIPSLPPMPSSSRRAEPDVPSNTTQQESQNLKTPSTAKSMFDSHSARTSLSFEHEEFEIKRVDSREKLRPAVSAVARLPMLSNPRVPAINVQTGALESVVSLPESVSKASLAESVTASMRSGGEDSLRAELQARADTPLGGGLSSLAWASLVAHAAVQGKMARSGETELISPVDTWADEELVSPERRMSDIPVFLRPGTPASAGSDMYFRLDALAPRGSADAKLTSNVGPSPSPVRPLFCMLARRLALINSHLRALSLLPSSRKTMATQTIAVLNESELNDGELKQVPFGESQGQVLLSKIGDEIHATSAFCTHYGAPLAKGTLVSDGRVVCPWHGACFNVCTGDIEDAPALDAIHSFKAVVRDGKIHVTADPKNTLKSNMKRPPILTTDGIVTPGNGVVIVGGGAGAIHTVESLRENGYKGNVTILSSERYAPIDRTKMSKALIGDPSKLEWRSAADLKIKYNTNLRIGVEVTKVDTKSKVVTIDGKETLGYDSLVLAPGSSPRRLPIEGASLANVFILRQAPDTKKIDEAVTKGKRLVVIGSSFISMEIVAAVSKRELASIDVIGMEEFPFELVLGREVGKGLMQYHESQGVKFHMKSKVDKLVPSQTDASTVGSIVLGDGGPEIQADVVIMGVGVAPATGFLRDSGFSLERDGGVLVDEYLRVAGLDDSVYAIGDIAVYPQTETSGTRRIEHWNVASNHGRAVGRAIAGKPEPFAKIPVFWSAQGQQLRYCGLGHGFDDVYIQGNPAELKFVAYYFKGGKVVAVARQALSIRLRIE
ncbi:hypothetical protein EW145_g1008 [Phellinidium pouzarii]|uniref:Rieske domain-containing protein n=1 Tax=Phellinidium pouzarii TaxID=167371 RepID=A0A4S4LGL9_9AGAM|nr:hypothetical protein EW145_g1008 [Phellinidium pouzarii]